jgi:PAS domain S-box-containing protein
MSPKRNNPAGRTKKRATKGNLHELLRESEERFRSMADSAPMPIWIKGPNDAGGFANKVALELFGRILSKAPGFVWEASLHPADRQHFVQAYEEAFNSRTPFRAQARFRNVSGEYRWYDTLGTPRLSRSGKFLGYVGASIDVTDAKRLELHARFINELDLELSEIAGENDIIWLLTSRLGDYLGVVRCLVAEIDSTAGTVLIRENWQGPLRGARSIAGEYRIADFTAGARVDPEKRQTTVINDVTTEPRTREFVENYKLLDVGALISVPIFNEGKWEAVLSVTQPGPREWRPDEARLMHDVGTRLWLAVKRARALDALRESEARARRTLAEQMVAGVAECDASGRFMLVNQRYCDITGLTREELLTKRISDITHPDDWPRNAELFRRLFEAGESFIMEKRYCCKDGSIVWVNTHVSPVRNASGKIVESVALVIDVTARKRAEQELAAAKDRLAADLEAITSAYEEAEAAIRAKDEFLAVISHELRSPLTSILGYARLLRDTEDKVRREHFVNVIERNGKAQLQLIEDLLDTARIASGKLKLEVQPLDLVGVIRDAIDVVRPAAQAKGIKLCRTLAPVGQVTGDPSRLQQVVWNLLSNAIKFTPPGGRVDVSLERADPFAQIVIRDTGKGIDPEFLPHIFERFRQSDMSSTRRVGGLGLGLWLVKQLVELHGGSIDASSEGHGAMFTVRLPLRAVYTAPTDEWPATTHQATTQSLVGVRVLIVDDEQEVRTLLTLTLEGYGAKTRAVSSAKDALAVLVAQPPDEPFHLMISDIGMPDEDGYGLMRKVRALPAGRGGAIPSIALTAYGNIEHRMRALEAGFQTYAVKPVEPNELVAAIQGLLKGFDRKVA